MKAGANKAAILTLLLIWTCVAVISGCRPAPGNDGSDGSPSGGVVVPHGYMARLEQVHEGLMIGFGPFVGYYFRPEDPKDLSRLQFVCLNENRFYSSDMPDNAKLYEGTALRTTLPLAAITIPDQERINPLFFPEAPAIWRDSRPEPRDLFVHFHSAYNAAGPVRTGYWLRHVAVADFTYDMGGQVGKESPLYHQVRKGPDKDFARIIEFDRGPKNDD